ncbi:hypothetical protein A5722_30605 [Mycobacterium vulneris]|uniref:Antitoxin n=1 Tax=Mycolicibacterium septicum DSM 44393 TaxID=1341646 RepID=A0A7X6MU24_9MYCO|nr:MULTISPECIES: type II toxin-antitoxin system prevent-host-death family antitoxin [Mycolicibacterium]MBX8686908.1 type II toxin-antitoxin system prevent-host-death family antitoxin [Mycobacterium sp. 20091114027_K0903767]MCP3810869.1 type II toxin-antitoxin system prevent-host-death family antitoxin [Mycobacteriaceae bacterium Msp059]OCB47912.1 hypothetical protein A5721_07420 [Mycolicibacterium vulneris]NKZ14940.1 type II toxin-antitoxin system prevent-host-death family antitoxin [Mycoliciba
MRVIGVRELRQHASRYLAEVVGGETIEITDRGQPVARLVPIAGDEWEDLVNVGEVATASRPLNVDDLQPAVYPVSASAALESLRSDER